MMHLQSGFKRRKMGGADALQTTLQTCFRRASNGYSHLPPYFPRRLKGTAAAPFGALGPPSADLGEEAVMGATATARAQPRQPLTRRAA
jgi:hypothetical protein